MFDAGPTRVRRLAIVSGAGADFLADAAAAGADALLTGEPAERTMAQARESGLHFIAAGHYATETFGVRAPGGAPRRALRRARRSSWMFRTRCELPRIAALNDGRMSRSGRRR